MTLKNIDNWPKPRYDSKINNIVTEFFIPALQNSTTYRRLGGFFSSTSLALAARGIKELIENEGKMQLIISPILTKEDSNILNGVSEDKRDEIISKSLMSKIDLTNEFEKNHVAALGYLLKKGFLKIKVDIPTDENGNYMDYDAVLQKNLLDEKLGLFQDRKGNVVAFRGPVNENKQSWERGTFAITVDVDWIGGQKPHVNDDIKRFEKIWNDSDMLNLPQETKENIIKNAPKKITDLNLEKFNVPDWAVLSNGNMLWPHQIRAINSWINSDFYGILSMATSGGKTLSALVSAHITPTESIVLIVVPGKVLITQWEKEIYQFDSKADLIVCDSDHTNWINILSGKLGAFVGNNKIKRDKHLIILATVHTAISDKFMKNFEHILPQFITLIADEVHHLGAPEFSKIFNINAQRRLGLSATFQRDWDEVGTERIIQYFGKPFEETYTITDGIREGKLSRYQYFPFFAYLNNNEFSKYLEYSYDIRKLYAQIKSTKNMAIKIELEKKYNRLLMNRAEIIKKAEDKLRAYSEILRQCPKKPYIVFADDNIHVKELKNIHKKTIQILNQNKSNNFEKDDIMTFSGELSDKERKIILDEAKKNKMPIFAMYCLDEGIDVPEFQSAILVSSSASKRQYIQRRGRILRTSKSKIAHLYDIVVLPNAEMADDNMEDVMQIIEKEKDRINELSHDAMNRWEVDETIDNKLKELGFK